jgi:hypothetical protein
VAIHKAKDNGLKLIFGDHTLFTEFIKDFIPVDMLKNISPSDVEDISGRFLPLFEDNKDSDTIKRINLHGDAPLFVIAVLEHESEVNYRASFKMLQYITLVLGDYEKEINKKHEKKISYQKGFKFPPVLPIVFYDGNGKWTAETNFLDKTDLNQVFKKYIPKFEYELVRLEDYSQQDLISFGDTLSLIMLIDKIRTFDGGQLLSKLPNDYIERLKLNIPGHLLKLLADVITLLLKRINIPGGEISAVTDQLYQRRLQEMFTLIDDYDVQATRKVAKAEGKAEGKTEGKIEGKIEEKKEIAINAIRDWRFSLTDALALVKLDEKYRDDIVTELIKQGVHFSG